jgi:hypothetical protein
MSKIEPLLKWLVICLIVVLVRCERQVAQGGDNNTDGPTLKTAFSLDFSTYFGGNGYEHARDIFVDNQGNIYVVGGTSSDNFPTTANVYDRTFDNTGTQIGSAGLMDAFITKFNASGQLIWSTYLGGPNYDRAYGIEVDSQGYVYVAGRAGPGFPTTADAFQPTFKGVDAGIYGMQNAFVAKLSPDGSRLVWASYVGCGAGCRDLAVDDSGDIYVPLTYEGKGVVPPSIWFANAFQKSLKGGLEDGVVKILGDGTQVIWATWLGGSGDDGGAASIRVDNNKYVYIVFNTRSTDIPTTAGAYDRTSNGGEDFYVAKLTPDGSNLVFATYLGGSGDEVVNTHDLALDNAGNVFVSPWTNSTDFPTTPNAFQKQAGGGTSDIAVAKFSPTGVLLASTYIGGSGLDNADGIYADSSGNVYLTGDTSSDNFPVTNNAYQTSNKGGSEAILFMLSSDLTQLFYSSYMGGVSDDMGRSGFLDKDGNLYVAGSTSGGGWPTKNAYQSNFQGGQLDVIIAKFLKSITN